MNNYLKTYKIILAVQSPVYIGSGKNINKKEYIFDYRTNTVHIPDFEKMFNFMYSKRLLEKYQDYLLKDRRDFSRWLKENGLLPKDYMPWIAYSLSAGDALEEMKSKKEIYSFVKDAYGKPYIPGSSLKGAIRTALLAHCILNNKSKYANSAQAVMKADTSRKRTLMVREASGIEEMTFNTLGRIDSKGKPIKPSNAVNDVMSGIRISDSKPLDVSALVLCQKVDENTQGMDRKMPLLRECLKPGTTVEFDLTIDTSLSPFGKDDIMAAINSFAQDNAAVFDSKFKSNGILKKDTIVIGGGAGYQTKTVSYALLGKSPQSVKRISQIIDATLGGKAKTEHKHYKDRQLGVSPHTAKRTYYQNKKYTMGVCTIAIK